jgi:hypothetical protein
MRHAPKREALLKQYHEAVQSYAKAVLCLDGDHRSKEFEVVHKSAEKARAEFDRTRKELKEHVTSHSCQPQPMLPGGQVRA